MIRVHRGASRGPKGEAAVLQVGGLRKRCRVWELAAECCQKLKEKTQGYCGSQKRVTIANRRIPCHARVAWRRDKVVRKDRTRNQAERGTPKRQNDGKRLWKGLECNNGIRGRGLRQHLQRRMRLKDPGTRQQLHLANKRGQPA
jgi:hypothetical protein